MADFSNLKTYAKKLVQLARHKAGSGRLASSFSGIDESELSRYASEEEEHKNRQISLFLWLALDESTGFNGLKDIARRAGFELVSKEQKIQLTECVTKLAGKAALADAEFAQTVLDAASDGEVNTRELREARQKKLAKNDCTETLMDAVETLHLVKSA